MSETVSLVAIDPGAVSAAMAVFFKDGRIIVDDLPVVNRQVDAASFANEIRIYKPRAAVVEFVASMPGQGVASTFKFGMGTGIIHGVVLGAGIPLHIVRPNVWKAGVGLHTPDKEAARALAIRLYPRLPGLKRKKDSNRAEALLIGHYWLGLGQKHQISGYIEQEMFS